MSKRYPKRKTNSYIPGRKRRRKWKRFLLLILLLAGLFTLCFPELTETYAPWLPGVLWHSQTISPEDIPAYRGDPYIVLNNNQPGFDEDEITDQAFETYSRLDVLGRCGTAEACVGTELMPTQERGDISSVTPSGWQSQRYDFVDQEYLYNRCHLIGFQLTGEDANERNLITGTRYLNIEGMLPFENQVADYVKRTGNHVMYRVTPVFDGVNLVADGVQIEAYSVEDHGASVRFNVFAYNVQPGVSINYLTGHSLASETGAWSTGAASAAFCAL